MKVKVPESVSLPVCSVQSQTYILLKKKKISLMEKDHYTRISVHFHVTCYSVYLFMSFKQDTSLLITAGNPVLGSLPVSLYLVAVCCANG